MDDQETRILTRLADQFGEYHAGQVRRDRAIHFDNTRLVVSTAEDHDGPTTSRPASSAVGTS
jgi:hypothetical protein